HRNDFASTSNAFPEAGESSNATPHTIVETHSFLGIASPPFSRRRRDDETDSCNVASSEHTSLVTDVSAFLSDRTFHQQHYVVPVPGSPRPTSKRRRNKQVPMLAAGANSQVLARAIAGASA